MFALFSLQLKDSSPKNDNSVIIYSPSSSSKPVWIFLFCWTQRKIFWTFITKLSWGTIDFHSRKSMVPQNCCVAHNLQNIFLCVQQNKYIVSKWWLNCHFWVNYPFKLPPPPPPSNSHYCNNLDVYMSCFFSILKYFRWDYYGHSKNK